MASRTLEIPRRWGFYGSSVMALVAAVLAYGLRTSQAAARARAAKIPAPA